MLRAILYPPCTKKKYIQSIVYRLSLPKIAHTRIEGKDYGVGINRAKMKISAIIFFIIAPVYKLES